MRVATVFSLSIIFVLGGVSASAVSWDSPVSVSETQLGSVAGTHIKAVSGHLVNNYTLSNASVYREGYPLYRYYIAFRKDKAARISYEEEKLLDAGGSLCQGETPVEKTLQQGIDGNLIKFIYTFRQNGGFLMTFPTKIDGKFDIQDNKTQTFELTVLASYNISIVAGTTCKQVGMTVHGTMVTLYQTNPNVTSQPPTTGNHTEPTKSTQTNTTDAITVPSEASKLLPLQAAVVLFAFINTFRG
ncbi:uncharacterized protein LOC110056718 [Orbicella faveolata]|uniref:uncharacterized protein LOC110056718 n=1 Tax=Orbicella faveolata TaxID=48498 RepID=UPI0009E3D676|nr:uncharacterized protein LOC110056718 [Orbicella faveolata]